MTNETIKGTSFMPKTEEEKIQSHRDAVRKYNSSNKVASVTMALYKNNDDDILTQLEAVNRLGETSQAYIKRLIREDIDRLMQPFN